MKSLIIVSFLAMFGYNVSNDIYYVCDKNHILYVFKINLEKREYIYYGIIGSIKKEISIGKISETCNDKIRLTDDESISELKIDFFENYNHNNYNEIILEANLYPYENVIDEIGVLINNRKIKKNKCNSEKWLVKYKGEIKSLLMYIKINGVTYKSILYKPQKKGFLRLNLKYEFNSILYYYVKLNNDIIEFSKDNTMNWFRRQNNETVDTIHFKKMDKDVINQKYKYVFDTEIMDKR